MGQIRGIREEEKKRGRKGEEKGRRIVGFTCVYFFLLCYNGTEKKCEKRTKIKFLKSLYKRLSIFLDYVTIKVQNKGGNMIAKERNRKNESI